MRSSGDAFSIVLGLQELDGRVPLNARGSRRLEVDCESHDGTGVAVFSFSSAWFDGNECAEGVC